MKFKAKINNPRYDFFYVDYDQELYFSGHINDFGNRIFYTKEEDGCRQFFTEDNIIFENIKDKERLIKQFDIQEIIE
jgi:hypothetical protein